MTAGFVVALGYTGPNRTPKADADAPMTTAEMRSLFEEKCSACHDAPDPDAQGFTRAQWQSTVNRMLNQHGANTSISGPQAAEIVDYLAKFPPALNGAGSSNEIGVWEQDPALSVDYPFTYGPTLQNFDAYGGTWKIIGTPDVVSGYLKNISSSSSPSILLENKHEITGGLDLEVQFRINQSNTSSSVGVVFGAADAKNYLSLTFAPSTSTLSLSKVTDGQAVVLQQSVLDSSQVAQTDWHSLRVKVTEGGTGLAAIFDYQQQIKTAYPQWRGGEFGLTSTGPLVAGFRQMTADEYLSNVPSPAGDVLIR